jgi:hypothetical protein
VALLKKEGLTFEELLADCFALSAANRPSYRRKMLHPVPLKDVVADKYQFICDVVAGKVVLDLGASGPLHAGVVAAASRVHALDLHPEGPDVVKCDFDDPTSPIPTFDGIEWIVAGEILEHLSAPGFLLSRLRAAYPAVPLVVSVPNAFSLAANAHIRGGHENVNPDHVAWYSPKTLECLLSRHGYTIKDWVWYNGQPYTAESIIAVAEPS